MFETFELLKSRCSRINGHVGRLMYSEIYNMTGVTEVRLTKTGATHSVTVGGPGAMIVATVAFSRSSMLNTPITSLTAVVFTEDGYVDTMRVSVDEFVELLVDGVDADTLANFRRILAVNRFIATADSAYYDDLEANNAITNLGVRRLFTGDGVVVHDAIDQIAPADAVPDFIAHRVHVAVDERVVVTPVNVFRAIRAAREAADPQHRVTSFDDIVERASLDNVYVDGDYLHVHRFGCELTFIIVDHRPLLVSNCAGFAMDDETVKGRVANFGARYTTAVRKRVNALCALAGER